MDQPKKELNFDESVRQVMEMLPPMIRTYLQEEKYTPVAKRLMGKYSLRIDQGGVLEREIMLLIMGIEEPEEFIASLVSDGKIPEETAGKIIADVNQEIFVPLREEMRKAVGSPAQPAPQARVQAPVTVVVPPSVPVRVIPPTTSTSISISGAPAHAPLPATMPIPAPVRSAPVLPTIAPLPPKTSLPGIPPALKPIPRGVPPVNAIVHPPLVPPEPKPPIPPAPVSYSTDPYREPIDEN